VVKAVFIHSQVTDNRNLTKTLAVQFKVICCCYTACSGKLPQAVRRGKKKLKSPNKFAFDKGQISLSDEGGILVCGRIWVKTTYNQLRSFVQDTGAIRLLPVVSSRGR
jgi:hypothetical protein